MCLRVERDHILVEIGIYFLRNYDPEIYDASMKELVVKLMNVEKKLEKYDDHTDV